MARCGVGVCGHRIRQASLDLSKLTGHAILFGEAGRPASTRSGVL